MGARDAWFRSPDWNAEAQRDFRNRIARSRSQGNRAQYIRIKAHALLGSPATRASGQALLREVIDTYSSERLQVVMALEDLGQSLEEDRVFKAAEETYRTCQLEAQRQRGGYQHNCAFMLARLIVSSRQREKYPEAQQLLEQTVRGRTFFNSELFKLSVLHARLAWEIGDKATAAHHARRALDLAQITEPQLPRHPTVGLVNADPATLTEMFRLASA